ncbi:hypothetical protein BU17DRAFT_66540 [Hysterangium stoloniferum]|nr:hypothetical protein BU17DRAFT_66540 [Hysterangium stoloniferum]
MAGYPMNQHPSVFNHHIPLYPTNPSVYSTLYPAYPGYPIFIPVPPPPPPLPQPISQPRRHTPSLNYLLYRFNRKQRRGVEWDMRYPLLSREAHPRSAPEIRVEDLRTPVSESMIRKMRIVFDHSDWEVNVKYDRAKSETVLVEDVFEELFLFLQSPIQENYWKSISASKRARLHNNRCNRLAQGRPSLRDIDTEIRFVDALEGTMFGGLTPIPGSTDWVVAYIPRKV